MEEITIGKPTFQQRRWMASLFEKCSRGKEPLFVESRRRRMKLRQPIIHKLAEEYLSKARDKGWAVVTFVTKRYPGKDASSRQGIATVLTAHLEDRMVAYGDIIPLFSINGSICFVRRIEADQAVTWPMWVAARMEGEIV